MPIELNAADVEALHQAAQRSRRAVEPPVLDLVRAAAAALAHGAVDDSLAILHQALVQDPRAARAWSVAAEAYALAGDLTRARRCAEHACSCDDDDLAAFLLSAELELRTGDADAARANASYALLRAPGDEVRLRAERILASIESGAR